MSEIDAALSYFVTVKYTAVELHHDSVEIDGVALPDRQIKISMHLSKKGGNQK